MTTSKKFAAVAFGIALITGTAIFYLRGNSASESVESVLPSDTSENRDTDKGVSENNEDTKSKSGFAQVGYTQDKHFLTDTEYAEAYKDVGAKTAAEARWMKLSGYPTSKRLVEYQRMSAYELERLANNGDVVAKSFLGMKLSTTQAADKGIKILTETASEGSIFALNALSDVHSSTSRLKDPMQAEAYLRAAQMRGDYAIAFKPRIQGLSENDYALSNLRAQAIIDELNASRKRRGLAALNYRPRPGATQAFEQVIEAIKLNSQR